MAARWTDGSGERGERGFGVVEAAGFNGTKSEAGVDEVLVGNA